VVSDQVGSPTYTRDLAAAICGLVHADARGFVSVTNSGTCSWFEFAQEILRQAGKNNPVKPLDTVQAARAAKRPAYSVLSPAALHALGITVRHWREALPPYLAELRKMGKLT
jgi:dTDP-4-dehydrorhamnose reductase